MTTRPKGAEYGRYEGAPPNVLFLDDGRLVRLMKPFAYISVDGRHWGVPRGAEVDGASIPRALWTFIGGPFEGRYRNASIIHDWFCDVRTHAWKDVHRMFYEAMLASHVGRYKAKTMYAAVYRFGPRWSPTATTNTRLATKGRVFRQLYNVSPHHLSTSRYSWSPREWANRLPKESRVPDDRRRTDRTEASTETHERAAFTLRFNQTDFKALTKSLSSRDLTLDQLDALADAQILDRFQRAARRGQPATIRKTYS